MKQVAKCTCFLPEESISIEDEKLRTKQDLAASFEPPTIILQNKQKQSQEKL